MIIVQMLQVLFELATGLKAVGVYKPNTEQQTLVSKPDVAKICKIYIDWRTYSIFTISREIMFTLTTLLWN